MPLPRDTQLGRYEIRSLLGEGGMGEVYLAEDRQLGRRVALKILPAELTDNVERLRRFGQEARAASALNHPNILTIHEIGQSDGAHFIATEFIDGETLRARIERSRLSPEEALDIAAQTAAALAAAHEAGIVHRDIKPENVMLRRDRLVKVLDFGLAKLTTTPAGEASGGSQAPTKVRVKTEPGVVMGTVSYMSPEQARGRELDARTDLWSLGVLLYEMVAGRTPFDGETQSDVLASILKSEPAPLRTLDAEVPEELERIVSKALAKDREERYQTAKDLLVDLRRLKKRLELRAELERASPANRPTAPRPDRPQSENATEILEARPTSSAPSATESIRKHRLALAASSALLLAAVAVGYWFFKSRTPSGRDGSAPVESIAVLPFVNASGNPDVEYLSDGITESLINNLSRLPALRVIARSTVFSLKGRDLQPQQVGRQLNVRAILNGRVVQRGDTLSVQVDLVDADSGAEMWGEQYQRKQADILLVQDEIARDVTDRLKLRLTGDERKLLTKHYTNNSDAYEFYLKGRFHYYKGSEAEWHQALDDFNQAIAKDPDYALAYSGVADCYGIASAWLMPPTEAYPKIQEAALKALERDNTLADAWAELASYKLFYEHDWPGAERELKHALELNPDSADAILYYSFYLYASGHTDECLALLKRALQSDPLSLPLNTNLGETFYYARRYEDSLAVSRKALEIDPDAIFPLLFAGDAYQQKGDYQAAVAQFQRMRQPEDNPWALASLGNVYAVSGRRDEALKMLAELEASGKRRYVSPYFFALIYTGLGDKDQAFAYLDKSFDEHNDYLIYLKVEPLFDPLRSDPRFADLLRRVGLTP
jgi:serine/threonine-protein kinase